MSAARVAVVVVVIYIAGVGSAVYGAEQWAWGPVDKIELTTR